MLNGLKQEFKGLLYQKIQEVEGSLEQKMIDSRIQECRNKWQLIYILFYFFIKIKIEGKILKFEQYTKSAEEKVLK